MGDAVRTIFKLGITFVLGVWLGTCARHGSESQSAQAQPLPPPAIQPFADTRDSMLRLQFNDGRCTGFKVGQRTLVTAYHCYEGKGPVTLTHINGQPVTAEVIANDGNDHVLVRVHKGDLHGKIVKIAPVPMVGTQVYTWGNPGGMTYQLRTGIVSGSWLARDGTYFDTFDMNNWHGDSGGPIFNMNGEVVAVHQGYYYDTTEYGAQFRMTITRPIAFTHEQLEMIE